MTALRVANWVAVVALLSLALFAAGGLGQAHAHDNHTHMTKVDAPVTGKLSEETEDVSARAPRHTEAKLIAGQERWSAPRGKGDADTLDCCCGGGKCHGGVVFLAIEAFLDGSHRVATVSKGPEVRPQRMSAGLERPPRSCHMA